MIRKALGEIVRIKRSETGSVTVEFCLIFPAFMFFILSAVEYSLVTVQLGMLDHGVDQTVRSIRLGTGSNPTHDEIKDSICERAALIRNCDQNLRLEMIVQDPYAGVNLPADADCTDNSEEAKPLREFENGAPNELMILRACAMVDPIFPTSAMGRILSDETGQIQLTAITAFVQEP
ncbi:TadE/TadG family type IV pilus assembly protein [Ruegeria sp.]|uniref:TadE/TadG family type IV pilus assembly protein n=1 Tax=Ruegeria sp. TaxID=1879320 RepID=UPI003B5D0513